MICGAWREEIAIVEHRWGKRIQLNLPVQLDFGAEPLIGGRTANVSLSGAFVITREPVPSQARIDVQFEPRRPRNAKIRVPAYIVRRTAHGIGLEWHAFAPPEIEALLAISRGRSSSGAEDRSFAHH